MSSVMNESRIKKKQHCVVLAGDSESPHCEKLIGGLQQRGLQTIVVPDAPGVMVELATNAKAALIVQEPGQVSQLQELLGAVRRYYPSVVCWQYASNGDLTGPRLTKLEVVEGHEPVRHSDDTQQLQASQSDNTDSDAAPKSDVTNQNGNRPLVSPEEMAMLRLRGMGSAGCFV